MDLKCVLTFSCLSLLRNTQTQNIYNPNILNPDLIYFNDEGQRYPDVLPLDNRQSIWANRDANYLQGNQGVFNPVRAQTPVPTNINNFGINPNVQKPSLNSFNVIQTPSSDMEPPRRGQNFADRVADAGESDINSAIKNLTAGLVDPVSLALSDFSIKLMQSIPTQQGNLVVSPFSIATLLALLQQGSLGNTQYQITVALQLTPNQAADGFRKLTENFNKRFSSNILNVANSIFVADSFEINPSYKRIARNDFGSELIPMKFNRPAVAAQKINNWVASKTNKKIDQLLTPEAVAADTQLVLVNAVYFKGLWAVKFKPESTIPKDFYMSNGGKKTASFMRMRRFFRTDFDKTINSQVLVLPFENDLYSLVFILPSETESIASVLASLTKEQLISYQKYTPKEVAVEIPKFTVKTDTDLVSVLRNLGIVDMFGPRAQLSGIGVYREQSPQVSSAFHSAMLSIDEQGGVAAAATSFGVVALSYDDPSIIFRANRPFLTILWDKTVSIPLFMAKIENPTP
ncbi:unnamed protein product [Diatraea saccharalis]|uniref:Serpin domain-containing protein n=1 Tax=Diatraea saccharalis TaxID=40085 RepID=A0A9N9RBQ9_9NEOP|nr:unnamed protein product [Diatraea saccharalis]